MAFKFVIIISTFELLLIDKTLEGNVFTRCQSDTAVVKFKETVPSALNSMPGLNTTELVVLTLVPPKLISLCIVLQALTSIAPS